jgi:hypothetical protein
MTARIRLPGRPDPLLIPAPSWAGRYPRPASRRVYAAAHVAAFPDGAIDWESTMAFREHLWAHGFAVADAMDTAQRGMGLTWDQARELITYSAQRAAARDSAQGDPAQRDPAQRDSAQRGPAQRGPAQRGPAQRDPAQRDSARRDPARRDPAQGDSARRDPAQGGPAQGGPAQGGPGHSAILACGAGTDQLADGGTYRLGEIVTAYEEQLDLLQSAGVQVILMASRAMAASTRSARDYLNVYGYLLGQAEQPVILHWLGESFDPQLRGYWGAADFDTAADTVIEVVRRAEGKVDGVKLSVLDPGHEVAMRRRLPAGVRLYTGDDFNYAELIKGGPDGHSDALLGAFAAITAPAAEALRALDAGDGTRYDAVIGPTVPLCRTIFEEPTFNYKAGIAFVAWLNGLQRHFAMLDRFQDRRTAAHLIRVFELAATAGALLNPDLAVERMDRYLAEGAGSTQR